MNHRLPLPVGSLALIQALLLPVVGAGEEGSTSAAVERDLDVVRRRLLERWTEGGARDLSEARRALTTLRPDGSWPDIDYSDRGRSVWKTVRHLYRVSSLARLYRAEGDELPESSPLRTAAISALRYWIEHDFKNPNWWWNEIGVPRVLGPSLLLLGDAVPHDLVAGGVKILERAKLGRGTGQNLLWLTEMALVRALIEKRADVVARAFDRIAEEIRVTTGEGIQPDFSFHQHGAQLYSGGYGYGFSVDAPRIAALARDTAFAFPAERIETLTNYILDGQRWMVRGGVFDHAALGREITRPGRGRRAEGLLAACEDLLRCGAPRATEIEEFAAYLRGGEAAAESCLTGHRHFWRSDFTVHRRRGYSTSVKMASPRLRGWEIVNSEGLRSHHTAEGMNLLYRTGDEYVGIFGAWDWLRVPGATIVQSSSPFQGRDARGRTTFVAGVSDGEYGVTGMALARDDLRARKAWFFFDREYIALGCGLSSDADDPVLTSVNQCHRRGEVTTSGDAGQGAAEGVWWAHHDRIGYVFPRPMRESVRVQAREQTGSWHAINAAQPDEPFTVDVFNLWVDHGVHPRDATYQYVVVPDIGPRELATYSMPIEILANRPGLQALRHRGLGVVGAVFYRPGEVEWDRGWAISVTKPCVAMIHAGAEGPRLAVCTPSQEEGIIEVVRPGDRLTFEFRREGEAVAGQSVLFGYPPEK